jgi:serine/threonine protein kinase
MKAARDRVKKALTITTRRESTTVQKKIRECSEGDVQRAYRLGEEVMASTNTGMEVLHAVRQADGLACVIKTRRKADSFKSQQEEREWRNTTVFQLNMPRVDTLCQFYEVLETKEKYYVVMEKVEGRDLFEQMAMEHPSHADSREIVRQVLDALRAMHLGGRIHKDLKIENVMVDMDMSPTRQMSSPMSGRKRLSSTNKGFGSPLAPETPAMAKLIDFDTVQDWEPTSPKSRDVLGTDGYIAPEAYDGDYSPASDVYAAGVIMYKLLTGRFPLRADLFDDEPGENWVGSPAMKRIQDRLKREKVNYSCKPFDKCPEATDLVRSMLAYDISDRPSCEEALASPYFMIPTADLP